MQSAMTPDAASGSERAACFTNLPPEVRNEIYRYLFSLQDACVERSYHDFTEQYKTYNLPVAILRTNRLVYQEAYAMLYNGNLLVLVDLDTSCYSAEGLFAFATGVAFNIVDPEAPMPPVAVHITHKAEDANLDRTRVIFAAADLDLICHSLHEMRRSAYSYFDAWLITVLKVPRHGWSSEKLLESVWKPLRSRRWGKWDQVTDRTGVFETRAEESATEGSSDVETDCERDTEEDNDDDDDE